MLFRSKEFQKTFTSLSELNNSLYEIEAYGNTSVSIYLEVVAYSTKQTVEFVQIGESIPLLDAASVNGFITDTYHGDPIFPYSNRAVLSDKTEQGPVKAEELSGTIELFLISKDEFENALINEYGGDTPTISIDDAITTIDELTAEYNRIGAKLSAYKKQANQYITFEIGRAHV